MEVRRSLVCVVLVATCALAFCQEDAASKTPVKDAEEQFPRRLDDVHLPNPIQLSSKVISGGIPEGDQAFRELAAMGVKTIISVDGAKPDVERAQRFGLHYVHLPHGYDGISEDRAKELAKAVRDLPGPVYVHCHHGKHRSPAAATVACVGAGFLAPDQAVATLELAGTSKNYLGLYEAAKRATPIDAAQLDQLDVQFLASVQVPPVAEAMVELSHTYEHLKLIAESEFSVPAEHPDLEPAHEALLLREQLTELLRTPEVKAEPEAYQILLGDAKRLAQLFETTLRDHQSASDNPRFLETASRQFEQISRNCKVCHEAYRDTPLPKL